MPETARPRGRRVNPFYVAVVLAGTALTLTSLGWLAAPFVQRKARDAAPGAGPGRASIALAAWLDRRAILVLEVESAVLIVSAVLAMATDRHFSPRVDPTA